MTGFILGGVLLVVGWLILLHQVSKQEAAEKRALADRIYRMDRSSRGF